MTAKQQLHIRLEKAIGTPINNARFAWFFDAFLEHLARTGHDRKELERMKTKHSLTDRQVALFSRYCGYNLFYDPVQAPLW